MREVSLFIIGALLIVYGLMQIKRALVGLSRGVYEPMCFFPCFGRYRVKKSFHSGNRGGLGLWFCRDSYIKRDGKFPIREINSNFFAWFIFWRVLAGVIFVGIGCYLIYLGI
ncbi:MAG: hypothetical protein QXS38_00340 [Candidatus Pacearchaeota archaeon]